MIPWKLSRLETHVMQLLHANVEGFLGMGEMATLYRVARVAADFDIVEIGSWKGLSTIALALGMVTSGNRKKVHAIDPFKGEGVYETASPTFTEFSQNINNFMVQHIVTAHRTTSEEAAKHFNNPISVLFIDGDHSYKACKHDIAAWYDMVEEGGFILFHDYGNKNFQGVTDAVNENITYGRIEVVRRVSHMVVTVKSDG